MSNDPSEQAADRCWHVLHTKPRQEKCLARQLLQMQQPFYLPTISRRRRIRGRMLTSNLPLFPGYCFVLATPAERLQALATRRVTRAIEVADQAKLYADLQQIYRLIQSGSPITPLKQIAPGVAVKICNGPLTGLHGKILRSGKQNQFVVQVDFIQQGAAIELEDWMLTRED